MSFSSAMYAGGFGSPRGSFVAVNITTDDHVFNVPARGLYVGGTGNVKLTGTDGVSVTFTAVPAGFKLDDVAIALISEDSTATNMVALV